MGTQNFRVKNGLEVGSATTITATDAFVDSQLLVVGVSTFQSDVNIEGTLSVGDASSLGDDIVTRNIYSSGVSTFVGAISGSSATFTGDLDVDGHTELDAVNVSGVSTFVGIGTFQTDLFVGGTLYAPAVNIQGGASLGDDLTTRNISASGIATISGSTDIDGDLDVDGHTELDNLNVSGVSTFVGIVTTQDNLFVGNDLSVVGDASIVGVLTVGSSSVTINGNTNTINVGTGVTIHTTTASVNQLEVAGLSTFAGIGTFQNDLFVGGSFYAPSINITGGASLGDDLSVRNVNASGIVTVASLDVQTNFDVYDTQATFHHDLYIAGNLSIGGTTTVISAQDLQIYDKDIILGVTTDANNNDVSNDTTANHGGIAIASTEGSPLVDLFIVGLETSPVTYKKFMWFKEGSFSGLGTDAWLSNYAVGIGSTQVPNGIRLAAGSVQVSDNTVNTENLNVSGVSTFTGIGTFQNNLYVGGSLYTPDLIVDGSVSILNDLSVANIAASGIVTITSDLNVQGHSELDNINVSGIITTFDLNVDGHAEFDNANVSGIITAGLFSGASQIGIQSGGVQIGVGITQLNFIGVGNTFVVNGTTVDISIAGGGGGGIGTQLDQVSTHGLADIFYTDPVLTVDQTITVDAPETSLATYTTYKEILVQDDADLIVEDENFIVDILDFGSII